MKILVACECSGIVRNAFRARGHDAWSCDLKPTESAEGGYHLEGDVRFWLDNPEWPWDMMIAHPDCTYLTSSGLHWNRRRPERAQKTRDSLDFVQYLLDR